MASTIKDIADTASHFVVSSLDNVKQFIDCASEEMAKADVIGANRRVADSVIDGTRETTCRVSEAVGKADTMDAVYQFALGTVEVAKDAVRVASEETERIGLVETGSRVAQEGLDLLRRQIELGFDTSRRVGDLMDRMGPFGLPATTQNRPAGVVTRVEIESDQGTLRAEPSKR